MLFEPLLEDELVDEGGDVVVCWRVRDCRKASRSSVLSSEAAAAASCLHSPCQTFFSESVIKVSKKYYNNSIYIYMSNGVIGTVVQVFM